MEESIGEGGDDGGRDTTNLLDAASSEYVSDGLVEELQLIQPYLAESSCCPKRPFLYLVMSSCMAALGGVIFGYDIGIVSGAIIQLRAEFQLDCIQQEMVVSSMLIGAVLASLTGGFIVDFIGRRLSIIINSGVFLVGAAILAFAPSFPVLIAGRFIVGFGVSLSAIAECIYISEIAPPKNRGLLVSVNEVAICIGLLLAYLINVLFIELPAGWRYMFGLSGVPAFVQGVGMFFLPYSPRWLIVKGQDQKACAMMAKLQWSGDPYDELTRIKSGLKLEYRYKFTDLISPVDNMRSRMLVGGGLVLFQQVSGQSTVVYYASTIFQALGFGSGEKATLASLGIGASKLFATIICLSTVDKGGRRRFLLIGASIMAVSMLALGIIAQLTSLAHPVRECSFTSTTNSKAKSIPTSIPFGLSTTVATVRNPSEALNFTTSVHHSGVSNSFDKNVSSEKIVNKGARYVTLSALVLFVAAYSFSFGPVSWLILSEIYPAGIKGRAFSVATLLNWGTSLIVSLTFLDMLSSVGTSWTFFVYAIVCIISVIFIFKYVPETKNKTLEQISAEFNARKPRRILPKKLDCCKKKSRHRREVLRGRPSQSGSTTNMLLANSQELQL